MSRASRFDTGPQESDYESDVAIDLNTLFHHAEGPDAGRWLVRMCISRFDEARSNNNSRLVAGSYVGMSTINISEVVQERLRLRDSEGQQQLHSEVGSQQIATINQASSQTPNTSAYVPSTPVSRIRSPNNQHAHQEPNLQTPPPSEPSISSFTPINRAGVIQTSQLHAQLQLMNAGGTSNHGSVASVDLRSESRPFVGFVRPSAYEQSLPTPPKESTTQLRNSVSSCSTPLQAIQSRAPSQVESGLEQCSSSAKVDQYPFPTHGPREVSSSQSSPLKNNSNELSVTYSSIPQHSITVGQSTSNVGNMLNKGRYFALANSNVGNSSNGGRAYVNIQARVSSIPPLKPNDQELSTATTKKASKKRKSDSDDTSSNKMQNTGSVTRPKRISKPKVKNDNKDEPLKAPVRMDDNVLMRIFEFGPPGILGKARRLSKKWKEIIDTKTSLYVNLRKENFGYDMPPPPEGITDKQYNDLLDGKGCLNPGCTDTLSSRAYWSWAKRWCLNCWKSKIEREDRVIKNRINAVSRSTIEKLLECLPYGMHDSFEKPHDIVDFTTARGRNAPRLYKYYLIEDVQKIVREYNALTPAEPAENSTLTDEQKATAQAAYQVLLSGLEEKRNAFFAERKAKNIKVMDKVKGIEAGVRLKREKTANPHNANREKRKALFTKRAQEEIGHIPTDFVQSTIAYKAAVRIFRDAGSERGWQTLKPKIVTEWEGSKKSKDACANNRTHSSRLATEERNDVEMSDDGASAYVIGSNQIDNQFDTPNSTANHTSIYGIPAEVQIANQVSNNGLLTNLQASNHSLSANIRTSNHGSHVNTTVTNHGLPTNDGLLGGMASKAKYGWGPTQTMQRPIYALNNFAAINNYQTQPATTSGGNNMYGGSNNSSVNYYRQYQPPQQAHVGPGSHGSYHLAAQPGASRMSISNIIQPPTRQLPPNSHYNNYGH